MNLDQLNYDAQGLVTVVVQDARTREVLTVAHANREALEATLRDRQSTFFSRSRQSLWRKGETSGNTQQIVEVIADCDADAVLYRVIPQGPACHTGATSCFHERVAGEAAQPGLGVVLEQVYATIEQRLATLPEGSYVARMHTAGLDRILKKIGEEAGEVIIAAKNHSREELSWEASDLLFHLLLVMAEQGLPPAELGRILLERHKPAGNP
jgi:phosphoribosyl-ATP pyrophosphohydrolase/phosphoribosyl-AMP cyclohydrolase